jgi:hypothetical protein
MINLPHRAILACAALALSACSSGQPPAGDPSSSAPSPAASTAPAAGVGSPSMTAQREDDIPTAIRGRWGQVPADCTSTRGDAKGLLMIDETHLRYYESVGTLGAIKERSGTRLHAAFAFSGEGMTWTRDEVLDVEDGGRSLTERQSGDSAQTGVLKYARCGG